jgi:hypothetical protein
MLLAQYLWNFLLLVTQLVKIAGCNVFQFYFFFWFNDNGNSFKACLSQGVNGARAKFFGDVYDIS